MAERGYLADGLHDVTDPAYDLLVEVGARVPRPLTVILERERWSGIDRAGLEWRRDPGGNYLTRY